MFDNLIQHLPAALAGATAFGIIAHAVNTFPTPTNKYGSWLLGVIQFAVGQRVAARNTLNGQDTKTYALPTSERPAVKPNGNGS